MTHPRELGDSVDLLNIRPIPELSAEQLAVYSPESLRVRPVEQFDPAEVLEILSSTPDGTQVVGVDLGGDKVTAIPFEVQGGLLVPDRQQAIITAQSQNGGANYLQFLENVAEATRHYDIPVGVSTAGMVEGTRLAESPNVGKFTAPFRNLYGSDYAELFPTVGAVNNDAQAAIKTAAVQVRRAHPDVQNTILIINGGGLGGGALVGDHLNAIEPGHVPATAKLNPFGVTEPCGMGGAQFVCVERTGSSGQGVEATWKKQTDQSLGGREISQRYQGGDKLAGDLYDLSALAMAHTIVGIGNSLGIMRQAGDTAVAYHGGGFRVPGLQERVGRIVQGNRGHRPPTTFTDNFSINAGAEGAAIAALASRTRRAK